MVIEVLERFMMMEILLKLASKLTIIIKFIELDREHKTKLNSFNLIASLRWMSIEED